MWVGFRRMQRASGGRKELLAFVNEALEVVVDVLEGGEGFWLAEMR